MGRGKRESEAQTDRQEREREREIKKEGEKVILDFHHLGVHGRLPW